MIKINEHILKPTIFPDGTSQVWQLPEEAFQSKDNAVHITWLYEAEQEFMWLAQLKHLLDRAWGIYGIGINLSIPYLPYGRQDKPIENGKTFALHTFAHLLNSLHFSSVSCLDPHSFVAGKLIENFVEINPRQFIRATINAVSEPEKFNNVQLIFPDTGAKDRYGKLFSGYDCFIIHAKKERDPVTGTILALNLEVGIKDKVLIIDDICDGGATFVALSQILKEKGVKEIYLYVTHGIFSRGLKPLYEAGIERIFTKDGEVFLVQDQLTIKKWGIEQ